LAVKSAASSPALWPVSDATTPPFMVEFYKEAMASGHAAAALANTQKNWLAKLAGMTLNRKQRTANGSYKKFAIQCSGEKFKIKTSILVRLKTVMTYFKLNMTYSF
jgi:CHAT domain-containing protein